MSVQQDQRNAAARWGLPSFSYTTAGFTIVLPPNGVTSNFHPAMGGMQPTNGNQNKYNAFFAKFKNLIS